MNFLPGDESIVHTNHSRWITGSGPEGYARKSEVEIVVLPPLDPSPKNVASPKAWIAILPHDSKSLQIALLSAEESRLEREDQLIETLLLLRVAHQEARNLNAAVGHKEEILPEGLAAMTLEHKIVEVQNSFPGCGTSEFDGKTIVHEHRAIGSDWEDAYAKITKTERTTLLEAVREHEHNLAEEIKILRTNLAEALAQRDSLQDALVDEQGETFRLGFEMAAWRERALTAEKRLDLQ